MGYQVKNASDDEWHELGEWFYSFFDLAEKLYQAKKFGHYYKRILIALPKSDLVSPALALGFSRAAYRFGDELAKNLELGDVKVGDLIQIRSAWFPQHGFATIPNTVVGNVVSITETPETRKFELSFVPGKSNAQRSIRFLDSPVGEKSPEKHIRIYDVPRGTPRREELAGKGVQLEIRKIPLPVSFSQKQTWERWEHQISPTLAVFGQTTSMEECGKLEFRDPEIHGGVLTLDKDSIYNAARLDSLTNDKKAHFVNVIEQISSFPIRNTPTAETLSQFPFVCLDGNAALVNLADEAILRDKLVIGLWETGSQANQEAALTTFLETATRFKQVTNLEEQLNWKPPTGVQCWGWK